MIIGMIKGHPTEIGWQGKLALIRPLIGSSQAS